MFYTCNNIVKVDDYFIIKWYQQMVECDFRGANVKSVLDFWVVFIFLDDHGFFMTLIKVRMSVTKDT